MTERKWLISYRGNRTQQVVADKIGISQSWLAKIEAGIMSPSVANAKKIADFYGFYWTAFYEDGEEQ